MEVLKHSKISSKSVYFWVVFDLHYHMVAPRTHKITSFATPLTSTLPWVLQVQTACRDIKDFTHFLAILGQKCLSFYQKVDVVSCIQITLKPTKRWSATYTCEWIWKILLNTIWKESHLWSKFHWLTSFSTFNLFSTFSHHDRLASKASLFFSW